MRVVLRPVVDADLEPLFEYQRDEVAVHMAAFTAEDPDDRAAFDAHWERIRSDSRIVTRTVVVDGAVAGSVLEYEVDGRPEVSYWIGREFWGKGVATAALRSFLTEIRDRPIYARVARDNIGSLRVLDKCGFAVVGEDAGYANARGEVTAEYLLELRDQT